MNQQFLYNIVDLCPSSNVGIKWVGVDGNGDNCTWTTIKKKKKKKTQFITQIGKKQRDKEKPSLAEHLERWMVSQDKDEDQGEREPVNEVMTSMEHSDPEMSVGLPNPNLQ